MLQLQPPQRHLDALPEIRRTPDLVPLLRAGPDEAALRGHDEVVGVRVERFGDEVFGDERAVRVGRVDEVDAELDGAAEDAEGLVAVGGRPPDSFAGDAHGAVAHAMDREVAAEGEGAGSLSGRGGHTMCREGEEDGDRYNARRAPKCHAAWDLGRVLPLTVLLVLACVFRLRPTRRVRGG